jgi:hypothetical protein
VRAVIRSGWDLAAHLLLVCACFGVAVIVAISIAGAF